MWGLRPLFIGVGALTFAYWGAEGTGFYLLGWGHQPVFIGVRGSGCSPGAFLGVLAQALRGVQGNGAQARPFHGVHRAWGRAAQAFIGAQGSGGDLGGAAKWGAWQGRFLGWRTAADSGDIY